VTVTAEDRERIIESGLGKVMVLDPEPAGVPACWIPVRIGALAAGRVPSVEAALLERADGPRLLYAGAVNELHGEPESGKGFVAGRAVAEVVLAGGRVLYVDFDADPTSVALRAVAGGLEDPDLMDERVDVLPIDAPLPIARRDNVPALVPAGRAALDELVAGGHVLVVFDNVNAGMAMHGFEPERTADAANWLRLFVAPFRGAGATVLLLDHVIKDADRRGRWQAGSIHKMNMIDGASFEVRVELQPSPGRVGRVLLVVSKDRHGAVRSVSERAGSREVAAVVEIDGTGDRPSVRVQAPTAAAATAAGEFRPTGYMERVSRFLEVRATEDLSQQQIADGVTGKAQHIRRALELLVAEGYVARSTGPRGALLHRHVRPYREGLEEAETSE
jgi:hypothetical protein